jgi:3-deoxy-D-manno-octulosonate 8-phosphate phosphatase (KDO 8-P phosphatase)
VPFTQGCSDKLLALNRLTRRLSIDPLNCACIVDDTPDLPLMSAVGMAAAVADAHPIVLSAAHWVARLGGGLGAVRELCDALLLARASSR